MSLLPFFHPTPMTAPSYSPSFQPHLYVAQGSPTTPSLLKGHLTDLGDSNTSYDYENDSNCDSNHKGCSAQHHEPLPTDCASAVSPCRYRTVSDSRSTRSIATLHLIHTGQLLPLASLPHSPMTHRPVSAHIFYPRSLINTFFNLCHACAIAKGCP